MSTWLPQPKDASSWSDSSKDTSTFANQSKATVIAQNGQYYGFGAFTYSGGQPLTPTVPGWANQIEH